MPNHLPTHPPIQAFIQSFCASIPSQLYCPALQEKRSSGSQRDVGDEQGEGKRDREEGGCKRSQVRSTVEESDMTQGVPSFPGSSYHLLFGPR